MKYTRQLIQNAVESKGYAWFEGGDYNLNIVGIRNSETKGKVTNQFDDHITISYSIGSDLIYNEFKATTDPGLFWEKHLSNAKGVAILVPGQYRGSHIIRLHGGNYEALGQNRPVRVYRDKSKDGIYDLEESTIEEGLFGINIHRATGRAGGVSIQVDKWSAGCQVVAASNDFDTLMRIAHMSADIYGNSFTYTLIESKDITS